MKSAKPKAASSRIAFLTATELADIDKRITAANRMRAKFDLGPPGGTEFARLVAEVRYWRAYHAPRTLSPSKEKRRVALIRSIKDDVATGRRITLITLSVADMEQTAAALTEEELRLIRFDIPGLCLAAGAMRSHSGGPQARSAQRDPQSHPVASLSKEET